MKARGTGVIINDIGAAGERFDYDYVSRQCRQCRADVADQVARRPQPHHGVRVVGINPGPVQTDRIVSLMKTRARTQFGDESRYGELMKNFPQGRAAKPREIADMIAFLASDRSGYTSGVIVTIDGAVRR